MEKIMAAREAPPPQRPALTSTLTEMLAEIAERRSGAECPINGAITMERLTDDASDKRRTPVVHQTCVGCGFCETMCPAEPAAIVVDARAVWPAQQGA